MISKKAKYVHIIWHPDLKFIPKLIKMINEKKEYFNEKDHLFITPHKRVYDELSKTYEIHLCGNENENLINKYGEYGEWIIVHAINCSKLTLCSTKKKYARKVIWRTWGHDIRPYNYYEYHGLKKIAFYLLWKQYVRKVRQFHMIAVANDIDLVNVVSAFGEVPNGILGYGYDAAKDKILEKYQKHRVITDRENIRILIGHSASVWDCHIDVMKSLLKYKDENITICLILSYAGTEEYVREVKNFAKQNYGNKAEIIDQFMGYEEYVEYLSSIDIGIFAQTHSTALSNISWLLYFGKTIYFKENSDFAKSFIRNHCKFCKVEDIENMDFEEFSKCKNSEKLMKKYGVIATSEDCCINWKKFLDDLDNKNYITYSSGKET